MDEEQFYTIILRHDTSTKWMVNDPILALGEYGVEDDTHKVKRGDGQSKWSELFYEDFGLQYIVTFENLQGEIADNVALSNKFDSKISKEIFDDVDNSIVTSMTITNGEENKELIRLKKVVKNIETGSTVTTHTFINSPDNTIQGLWSIDDNGNRVLSLYANNSISNFESYKTYHQNDMCFYDNKLYRANDDFMATAIFNENDWTLITSKNAEDIIYNNTNSNLDATNVKDAIDELKTYITNLETDLVNQIKAYTNGNTYTATGTYITQKFVTITNNDGVLLLAKVLTDFTADSTHQTNYECFMYDVEQGKLELVGNQTQTENNNI